MKRIILIIGALLIGFVMQAQSVTYTCRYWFDKNQEQAVTATFSDSIWQAELDVGLLPEGLHTLYLHVMDTSMRWGAPQSFLFLKTSSTQPSDLSYHYWFDQDHEQMQSGTVGNGILLLDLDSLNVGLHTLHVMLKDNEYSASQSYLFLKTHPTGQGTSDFVYHCWFNQDIEHKQSNSLGSGNVLLDVADLEDGMHTINVMLEGDALTSTQSFLFMKVATFDLDTADMSHLVYHCWFDQDFENQQTDSLRDGHFLLDVDGLVDGLHTVNVMLEGGSGTLTTTQSYMFMKIAAQDPSVAMQYRCWFDQDYSTMQTGPVGAGVFEIEMGELSEGFHTLNVQLDNGSLSAPQTYLFYRLEGIDRWEYWLNGNTDIKHVTQLPQVTDTLDIVALLPVETWPIRSTCFHFQPNDNAPYLNAKNEITFRFWSSGNRFIDKSNFYVDEQVQQDIVAQVFERNTTETFTAPRDNQIQWFKLDAVVGDSLAFVADKACTMQLFAPSGEEVFNVSGPESITLHGLHAWEDGTYYLAVHDMTGSGETLSVTYNWVYRYAILAYDVHLVGNGGCSTITFNGNGYNSLLDAYFMNAQNDTIRRLDIGHESNTTTTVTFNFYEVNLGVYDAVFQFYEEEIRINGALEVQEPVDIVLTSTVSYPTTFRRDTECTYTFTITNEGNMTAYNVPLNIYIATESERGISHLSMEGLKLSSLYDYVKDLYDWSDIERRNLIEYSDFMGEDHYFFRSLDVDENIGDTVFIRSGIFSIEIPPYSTREVVLQLTASEFVDVWFSNPNESFPRTNQELRDGELPPWHFCCWQSDAEAVFNGASSVLGFASAGLTLAAAAVGGVAIAAAPTVVGGIYAAGLAGDLAALAVFTGLLSCGSGVIAMTMGALGEQWCGHEKSVGDAAASFLGLVAGCVPNWGELMHTARPLIQALGSGTSAYGAGYSAIHNTKDPRCTDNPPKGGKSTPVAPCEPNEIRGYLAESGSHYMMQEIQTIPYEIESENDTTATAAAHTIIVRDTLDVNKFDVASLAAYRVTIHDKVLELNGEHNFVYTLDLRPNVYVIAQIQLECDDETGIVVWTITSLDPMTMEPTTDPNQGALPINYNGEGIATFTFNVNLKEPFPDGTEISNRVGIIFDLEEPVITDTWTNTVDAVKPTSHIEEVTVEADTLNFSFVSSDNRSGVWYHTLYYRNDSTAMEWQVKKAQIFENSYKLRFDEYQTTEYLVTAIDSAGNVEDKEMVAEYVHYYDGPAPSCQSIALTLGWNWFSTNVEITLDNLKAVLLDALPGATNIRISSKDANSTYNGTRWRGTLNALDVTRMYMIQVPNDCEITLEGLPLNPAELPITIVPGVNWIGFPLDVSMSLTDAFAGFAVSGDKVSSKNQSATYTGTRWRGTLNILEPGQGYLFQSGQTGNRTLVFPNSTNSTK